MSKSLTFLCVSFYFKGEEFLKAAKAAGNTVFLLTRKNLEHKPWPKESIDEFFYMDSDENTPENIANILKGTAWLMRGRKIDRVVALDDFDVEKAAAIREEFRLPGMGQTTARYFRDKLAMRIRAAEAGIPVPGFSALFTDEEVNYFADNFEGPWLVKPRGEASATGIKKAHNKQELWDIIHNLGERRHLFLVEQFKPGDVYHADALTYEGKVIFCWCSQYLNTPMEVAHGAGIFRSVTCPYNGEDEKAIQALNAEVMKAFGMKFSASHTEFIKSKSDGKFYFLETSSRVGGANLGAMVEAASGVNLWAEWARVETSVALGKPYKLPKTKKDYSGIIISLARQEKPDLSVFDHKEIFMKMDLDWHVGIIINSKSRDKVLDILEEYMQKIYNDYHASAPLPDKPTS
ncbi:MAG: ATP-grasp domain-containing protein [Luteibaculaceae bacterium]